MKKSKAIAIGLLSLSLAACHRKKHYQGSNHYYISTDPNGNYYGTSSNSAVWLYYYMYMSNGRYVRVPSADYRPYGSYSHGSYSRSITTSGHSSSISRGGFGHSASGHGSSGHSSGG